MEAAKLKKADALMREHSRAVSQVWWGGIPLRVKLLLKALPVSFWPRRIWSDRLPAQGDRGGPPWKEPNSRAIMTQIKPRCLPCPAPHDGMTQQPLLHHLHARVTLHPVGASRVSRKHIAFASHLTMDCITATKVQSLVSSIVPFSFYAASCLFCTQMSIMLHPNIHKRHSWVTCCLKLQ